MRINPGTGPDRVRQVTYAVAGALGVLVLVLVGLVLVRNTTPTPAQQGDAVRAAASATLAPLPAPTTPTASPSPTPSTPRPTVVAPDRVAVTASAPTRPTAPARPGRTVSGSLFAGAVYAAGADQRPTRGGVRLSTTGAGPLAGRSIVIDPGHNGNSTAAINNRPVPNGVGGTKPCNTSGTATAAGYSEHAHNWSVATRLAGRLRDLGATVTLTRPDDDGAGPCVDERAAIGNRAGADLVVSVHADGSGAGNRGFHVITSTAMAGGAGAQADSARAAALVRDAYARVTGLPRSTYLGGGTGLTPRRDIAGLNLSRVPAVMLEGGNMGNPAEARLLSSTAFHDRQAQALTDAALAFLTR